MRIVSVNVSEPKPIAVEKGAVLTGIFKQPIAGLVEVGRRNLAGDRQADTRVHGGVDKAVYAYPHEHYAAWQAELDRNDFVFGQFGENLTVEGMLEDRVRIGDRYRVGTALLEVSQPRFPCFKLGIRMNDAAFVKLFFASRKVGFYLRVIEEGVVQADDPVEQTESGNDTIAGVYDITFGRPRDAAAQRRLLDDPKLASAWKDAVRDS